MNNNKYQPDFTEGLNEETGMEVLGWASMFIAYAKTNEIDTLRNKFDWYFEQYNQMIECGKSDFLIWITDEVSRQRDMLNHHGK